MSSSIWSGGTSVISSTAFPWDEQLKETEAYRYATRQRNPGPAPHHDSNRQRPSLNIQLNTASADEGYETMSKTTSESALSVNHCTCIRSKAANTLHSHLVPEVFADSFQCLPSGIVVLLQGLLDHTRLSVCVRKSLASCILKLEVLRIVQRQLIILRGKLSPRYTPSLTKCPGAKSPSGTLCDVRVTRPLKTAAMLRATGAQHPDPVVGEEDLRTGFTRALILPHQTE
jgi:hypothetical protein